MVPAILLGWWVLPFSDSRIIVSALVLFLVSLADDIRGLPIRFRLVVHMGSAAFLALSIKPEISVLMVVIAALAITWVINLYNFMDGADGLAGGMSVIGFAAFAWLAWQRGAIDLAIVNLCVVAAAFGFLLYNFAPAKVFLGDSGSVPLGYLAAAIGIVGTSSAIWDWWFPVVVFSPFIVDATQTIVRRLVGGASIVEAHRDHCYQRLIRSGWSHRRTAIAEYVLMVSVSCAAVFTASTSPESFVYLLIACGVVYAIVIAEVERIWSAAQNSGRRSQ